MNPATYHSVYLCSILWLKQYQLLARVLTLDWGAHRHYIRFMKYDVKFVIKYWSPVFLNWSLLLKNTKYNYSVTCIVDNVHFGMTWHVTTQDINLRKCLEWKWMMSVYWDVLLLAWEKLHTYIHTKNDNLLFASSRRIRILSKIMVSQITRVFNYAAGTLPKSTLR